MQFSLTVIVISVLSGGEIPTADTEVPVAAIDSRCGVKDVPIADGDLRLNPSDPVASDGAIGTRGQVGCGATANRVRRLSITQPGLYENILVDGGWSDGTLVKIQADGVTLRNCEIRNGSHNGITILGRDIVIENCKVHHLLAGTFSDQKDAHGITGRPNHLVIRNCDIGLTSGDAIQFDPGRGPWNDVIVENCTLWADALNRDASGFRAGERPGENAIDTKQRASNPRSHMIVRNCLLQGWNQPAQISNVAALNLKNHVQVDVENCIFRDNEICLRVRGGEGPYGGAIVTVKDCAAYESSVAIRAEDNVRDLKIHRFGLGDGVRTPLVNAGGGAGSGYENVGEFTPEPFHDALKNGFMAPKKTSEPDRAATR